MQSKTINEIKIWIVNAKYLLNRNLLHWLSPLSLVHYCSSHSSWAQAHCLYVWHFCFLKTFMKLQSKANEQKNNIIRKAVYPRTPAHEPEVVFWVISSCSSIEIWFLCDLTKTLSLRLNIIGLTRTHDICQKYTSMLSEENDSTQNTQIASLSSSYGNSVNVFDIISTE